MKGGRGARCRVGSRGLRGILECRCGKSLVGELGVALWVWFVHMCLRDLEEMVWRCNKGSWLLERLEVDLPVFCRGPFRCSLISLIFRSCRYLPLQRKMFDFGTRFEMCLQISAGDIVVLES